MESMPEVTKFPSKSCSCPEAEKAPADLHDLAVSEKSCCDGALASKVIDKPKNEGETYSALKKSATNSCENTLAANDSSQCDQNIVDREKSSNDIPDLERSSIFKENNHSTQLSKSELKSFTSGLPVELEELTSTHQKECSNLLPKDTHVSESLHDEGSIKTNIELASDEISNEAAEVLASLPDRIPILDSSKTIEANRDEVHEKQQDSNTYMANVYPESAGPSASDLAALKPVDQPSFLTDDRGPLETLANAALGGQGVDVVKSLEEPAETMSVWCDVGVFKGTSCHVTSYYVPSDSRDPDHKDITSDHPPDYTNSTKVELESGSAYKFRICAVNSCGRGPWSEFSIFRTSLPGFPGAPSSVAISRSAEGAHLSWQPPSNPAGKIVEYTVCLAVKNPSLAQNTFAGQKLTLIKVYSGPHTQTIVPNSCLAEAHIDTTNKPAIIFRIAAKNEKGFGPPTQVRWLQDVDFPVGSVKC